MKKTLLASLCFVGLLTACGEATETKTDNTTSKVEMKMQHEIHAMDSVATQLENAAEEIDAASKELDDLLNEI